MPVLLLFALAMQQTPHLTYRLTVDTADLGVLNVAMHITGAADSFTVAAHAHPEYDDKYWRYLENMRAEGASVARRDSVLWQVTNAQDSVTLRYTIRLPAAEPPRAAWRAYLTPQGGVIGGPHSFLYIVGAEHAPASVQLQLPAGWSAASALRANARLLHADSSFDLVESQILVGRLRQWTFDVGNIPHHVFYLAGATPTPFDTTAFLDGIRRIVQETVNVFRDVHYRQYYFLLADDAYGGLEHANSAVLGAPSRELAEDPHALAREFAHEFFHTWNLMRIRPAEYRGVDYRVQPPVPTLWFSEGLSLFYSDVLRRRAGFTMTEPARTAHLQGLVMRYLNDPAYLRFSPERISSVAYNSAPGALGNSAPSTHLIGEVLASVLDLIIRDRTDGRRSMDDVMRLLNERHARSRFTGADLQKAAQSVCSCTLQDFFDGHVRNARRLDFDRYLAPFGLRVAATRERATDAAGEPERDFRIRAWQPTPQDTLRLMLFHEASIWSLAGLRTNDRVLTVNNAAVRTWPELRTAITAAPLGSTLRFDLVRNGQRLQVPVRVTGFERTRVEISALPNANARQLRLREQWLSTN
jgi:predicted metalloprotease with PDZ domain